LVLIPVAAAIAFLAFLVAILPTWVSSLIASVIAIVAFIISLIAMAISFSIFGVIKNNVNRDGTGSHAYYGVAQWLLLAATLALLLGSIIVFCSCCSTRNSHKTSKYRGDTYNGNGVGATGGRRKWFQRRRY
jgi:glucan phosphoethanolaminetransferase (alkaline phosphatase superfamily)